MPIFSEMPWNKALPSVVVYANQCLLCDKPVITTEKKKYYVCPVCNKKIVEEYIDKFVAKPWWNIITP